MTGTQLSRRAVLAWALATSGSALITGCQEASPGAAADIGSLLFMTDWDSPRLTAFDMGRGRVHATTDLPTAPSHLIATPETGLVAASDPVGNRLWVMDGTTLTFRHTASLNLTPWLMAFSADGHHLAAADMGAGTIEILDPVAGETRYRVGGFEGAHDLRFGANSADLFVSTLDSPTVRAIDLRSGRVTAAFDLPAARHGIDHLTRTADGEAGILIGPRATRQDVAVIDLRHRRPIRWWRTDRYYRRAYSDPYSRFFLLASDRLPGLDLIHPATGQPAGHVATETAIDLFAYGFLSSLLVIGHREQGRLALVESADLTVVDTLAMDGPIHSVFMEETRDQATVVMADGRVITLDVLSADRHPRFEPVATLDLAVRPDLTTHANSLSFCHA